MNSNIARPHWFFIFNNVPDLPEVLITGREETWLRFIFSTWTYNPELFGAVEIATYTEAAYSQPGALRGAFSDYRVGEQDVAQDKEDRSELIEAPTLVLWGEDFEAGGKMWNFHDIWSRMAKDPKFVSFKQCGHLPQEEQPDQVNRALLEFLTSK